MGLMLKYRALMLLIVLLARRLAEQDVRFIQLYHMGWDQHDNLPSAIEKQAKDT